MGKFVCATGTICPVRFGRAARQCHTLNDPQGSPLFVLRSCRDLGRAGRGPVRVCGRLSGGALGGPPVLDVVELEPVRVVPAGPLFSDAAQRPALVQSPAPINVSCDFAFQCRW